jgi:large conductance mechanosensitive channel
MKKFFNDFKDFISRGNIIDLAVGVIIGGAFSTVVKSLVNNLLMPPLGLLFGNTDFSDLFIILKQGSEKLDSGASLQQASEVGAVTFNYGQFLTDLLSFLLLAVGVFFILKGIYAFQSKEEEEESPPTEKACPFCKKSISIAASRCPYCTSELE